jgi:hypothetical protein
MIKYIPLMLALVVTSVQAKPYKPLQTNPKCTTAAMYQAARTHVIPEALHDCTILDTGHTGMWFKGRPGHVYVPRWTADAWRDVTIDPPEVLVSKEQLRKDPVQQQLRRKLLDPFLK